MPTTLTGVSANGATDPIAVSAPAAGDSLASAPLRTLTQKILDTIQNVRTALALKSPLASPTFTGTVTLPATGGGATEAARKDYVDEGAFVVAARIDTDASILSQKGSVTTSLRSSGHPSAGTYKFDVPGLTTSGIVTVQIHYSGAYLFTDVLTYAGYVEVHFYNESATYADRPFSFVVHKL